MKSYIDHLRFLSRTKKTVIQIFIDALLLSASFFGAMIIRLESLTFLDQQDVWGTMLPTVFVTILVLWKLGLYNVVIRFLTGQILTKIFEGIILGAISIYVCVAISLRYS